VQQGAISLFVTTALRRSIKNAAIFFAIVEN
jgi:hypothetical protein